MFKKKIIYIILILLLITGISLGILLSRKTDTTDNKNGTENSFVDDTKENDTQKQDEEDAKDMIYNGDGLTVVDEDVEDKTEDHTVQAPESWSAPGDSENPDTNKSEEDLEEEEQEKDDSEGEGVENENTLSTDREYGSIF